MNGMSADVAGVNATSGAVSMLTFFILAQHFAIPSCGIATDAYNWWHPAA